MSKYKVGDKVFTCRLEGGEGKLRIEEREVVKVINYSFLKNKTSYSYILKGPQPVDFNYKDHNLYFSLKDIKKRIFPNKPVYFSSVTHKYEETSWNNRVLRGNRFPEEYIKIPLKRADLREGHKKGD